MRVVCNIPDVSRHNPVLCHNPELIADAGVTHRSAAWLPRLAPEAERDTRFVELGRYLCEVRARRYRRVEKLKSFDELLARRFPESRRQAYHLMSIHEHLPPQAGTELKKVGWTKGA